jgi:hypothetical protein
MADTGNTRPKQKVRTHWRLPAALPPEQWLRLVIQERPARNRLGALTTYQGRLVVAAYLGRQVHVVPIEHAHGSLRASLEPEERVLLDDWLARAAAGEFVVEVERERKRGGWPAGTW